MSVAHKLEALRARIEGAAKRSGRDGKDVILVAVTKGAPAEAVREAMAAGLTVFGENKVQEAQGKIPEVGTGPEWHMVGHLQSNKVKSALELFTLIHSVDSVKLAKNLSVAASLENKTASILLEINISGEAQKYGFAPEEIYGAVDLVAALPSLKVLGLMGMAAVGTDPRPKREAFRILRNLFSVCKSLKYPSVEMRHLSMGMSDDFEIAIEEGSNMVRIGRVLFKS